MEENQKGKEGKPGENGHETENDSVIPDEVYDFYSTGRVDLYY